MSRGLKRLLLLGATLALSTSFADDLEDLKAAEELRLKLFAEGKHVERTNKLIHDQFMRIFPQYPFPIDNAKPSNPEDGPGDGASQAREFHRINPVNYKYRVVGDTGLVWGLHRIVEKLKDGPQRMWMRRVLLVYTKADGGWKLVARHDSYLPPAVP